MAGKSTFLRQNALIAVLAQMGSFVPAKRARIGVVDRLFSRVGAADDLARGRSTFMVEMVETAAILNQAGERALVILDEIGRGTATFDGLSIAWAAIEHLHETNRCRALFATHFHELTALAAKLARLHNATMRVKEWHGDVVFLHEVVAGAADRSYGIQVAKLAGLPPAVIERAKLVLAQLEAVDRTSPARTLIDDLPLFAATRARARAEARDGRTRRGARRAQSRRDVAARGAGGALCAQAQGGEELNSLACACDRAVDATARDSSRRRSQARGSSASGRVRAAARRDAAPRSRCRSRSGPTGRSPSRRRSRARRCAACRIRIRLVNTAGKQRDDAADRAGRRRSTASRRSRPASRPARRAAECRTSGARSAASWRCGSAAPAAGRSPSATTLSRMPPAASIRTRAPARAKTNHTAMPAARLTSVPWRCARRTKTSAHQDGRGIHRQARERALRDERRVVVEREEDVGGPGRDRQRRDQRADRRPGALGDHRGRDHERRRDRHAQREREEEGEVGGHLCRHGRARPKAGLEDAPGRAASRLAALDLRVPAQAGVTEQLTPACSFTSTGGPLLMV